MILLFFYLIFFVNASVLAMDAIVITLKDAHAIMHNQKEEKRLRIVQRRDTLLKNAESHLEKGLFALGATWLWTSVMCCSSGSHPTQSDAYILGCTSIACCTYCGAACSDCCKAMVLPKYD